MTTVNADDLGDQSRHRAGMQTSGGAHPGDFVGAYPPPKSSRRFETGSLPSFFTALTRLTRVLDDNEAT